MGERFSVRHGSPVSHSPASKERRSRELLLEVLARRSGGDASDAQAASLANEAKHRSRAKRAP